MSAVSTDEPLYELPPRYEDRGLLGEGAMGVVRRVRDRHLRCDVAMKILRRSLVERSSVARRFEAEARLMAALRHPGIAAVHDLGELPDGRLWFTMPVIEGRTLRALVQAVFDASDGRTWGRTDDGWDLRGLIEVLQAAAEAVGHAHAQGVVHRDIKPSNLMIGRFREVQLMDWGIARGPGVDALGDGASLLEAPSRHRTMLGHAIGTPPYMAPEQARGERDRVGPRSDVYALGALLYKVLSGRSPYRGRPEQVLEALRRGPPPSVTTRGPLPVPDELARVCEECMHRQPERRPPDGAAVADVLRTWLDRDRRRDEAEALLERAREERERCAVLGAEAWALAERLHEARRTVPDWESGPGRRRIWALEDQLEAVRSERRRREVRAIQTARAALSGVPDLRSARDLLADIYRERAEQALDRRDARSFQAALGQLRVIDTGRHARWIEGTGWLTLHTRPAGARVDAWRLEERSGVIEPVRHGTLGVTPLDGVPLPAGSWLLEVRGSGCEVIKVPVVIEREEHSLAIRPGERTPLVVPLPAEGTLGEDVCYVPGGWFRSGGTVGIEPEPPRRLWVDGFVIERFPVTIGGWHAFLADRLARGRSIPRSALLNGQIVHDDLGLRIAEGVSPRLPASLLDPSHAAPYAAWRRSVDGLPWRLPHDLEWEKAARGVDGRLLPWGSRLDPALACVLGSQHRDGITEVDAFPTDVSVYGVRGTVGNVRDLCSSSFRREPLPEGAVVGEADEVVDERFTMLRGGRWNTQAPGYTCASRVVVVAGSGIMGHSVGLRLARDLR